MLTQSSSVYVPEYPHAIELTEQQMSIFWHPNEINVEKDTQDILVNLLPAEKHGVLTTLKLFTMYELIVGGEYWQSVAQRFQKPACVARMANCFGFFELNVHAPFYAKINEALGLANEQFYTEYTRDETLSSRIEQLETFADASDPEFLMMLALTEGAILYSSFAFLKHFQSQGKNKILNIVRGINFSARDENLHSEASAWLFRTLVDEQKLDMSSLHNTAVGLAESVRAHEHKIVDMIFDHGDIPGITATQLKNFVDSRIDVVLRNLGFKSLYSPKHNPIAEWFYQGINSYQSNDFFSGKGNQYVRTWNSEDFKWKL